MKIPVSFSPRWIFKRTLGLTLGSFNLAGIYASIKLVELGTLNPMIASLDHWFTTPFQVNLATIFKFFISASIYLAGLPLSLLSLLANRILGAGTVHLNSITDALQLFLQRVIPTPGWAGLALISPAQIFPFDDKILSFMHVGDQALAIVLAAIVTATLTSITFAILNQDLPESFEMAANRRNSTRIYSEIKRLQDSLSQIRYFSLPNDDQNRTLATVASYFSNLTL
jgi:hypothetical protein